ncbi:MAG: hypothetical protein LLG14_02285 [Nocardiaceae bacterium]|nr:hypothetical protein [Nocardiaceae bacterium]
MTDQTTRAQNLRWAAVSLVGVTLGYAAVLLANIRHFYTDDSELQYVPLWVHVGKMLREGTFPTIVPEEWQAGNYLVEGQSSIFNPPQFLINLLAPSFSNLLLLATLAKLLYSLILALGVFRVCLNYGARPQWAAVAAVAFPFSGWMLFFDQATWVLGLAGTAWLTHAWASGVRYARGHSGPIPVFTFLFFAIGCGYIWPGIESALMIASVIVGEWIYRRHWKGSAKLAAVAMSAALVCVIIYIAGVMTAPVTLRRSHTIINDGQMTIPWSESLNASLPTTHPTFSSWFGIIFPLPVVYIAWFLIPALAFIDWKRAREGARELCGIAIFAGLALTWTAGPAAIGVLRWPVRVLPMLALGALILVCTLLSRYGTLAAWRTRAAVAGGFIVFLFVRSIASAPRDWLLHAGSVAVVVALGLAALWLARSRGTAATCLLLILSVAPIAGIQVRQANPHPLAFGVPANRTELAAQFPHFTGTTLQLSQVPRVPGVNADALHHKGRGIDPAYFQSLTLGNIPMTLDQTYANGYTPVGYAAMAFHLCMKWDGTTCPEAYQWAFTVEPSTGKTLVDLMKIDRVVLHKLQYPNVDETPAPAGWHWAKYPGHEAFISVLERNDGLISTRNGRISDTQGVTAQSTGETDDTSSVRVSSANGGRIVFARLDWPGYHVTLNGKIVPHTALLGQFITVDIPAGTNNADLEVSYEFPGWKIGAATAVLGLLGLAILQVLHIRSRRRPEPADPVVVPVERELEESLV